MSRIGWDEIHRRMEASRLAIEKSGVPDDEAAGKILKARAAALAARRSPSEAAGETARIISFLLAGEKYAVEARYVREVYPLKEIAQLPCVPPFVLGIINLHGRIVSVLDLKRFFDLPDRGLGDLNKVLVLDDGSMEFGILADVVLEAAAVHTAGIHPSPVASSGIRGEYIKGIAGDRTIVLDAGKILSDRRIVVREEIEK